MRAKPTIRDVAEAAEVSIKTVSRVSNGDPNVAVGTAQRVQEAIERLGYRANPLARSLRTGRDAAIGLIVESIRDPFFAAVTDAVEEAAREAGLVVIIASAGRTPDQERQVVTGMLNRSVRGLIIVPCHLDYASEQFGLGPGAVPVVFVDRPAPGLDVDTVTIDNLTASRAAAQHLLDHGHRRIAFVGTEVQHYPVSARVDGYRRAMREAGVAEDDLEVISLPRTPIGDELVLADALQAAHPPTALLAGNAIAALVVVRELHQTRRTDVAVVSFDDFPMADALDPPITVHLQNPQLMGRRAFELLLGRIAGDHTPGRHEVLPTSFIARGSGEVPPTASPVPVPIKRRIG